MKYTVPDTIQNNINVTLDYTDLETKTISSVCIKETILWMQSLSIVLLVLFVMVFLYDYLKDIGRNVSNVRDVFSGGASGAKILGFTKGNFTRAMITYGLLGSSILFYYLSGVLGNEVCLSNQLFIFGFSKMVNYNEKGIPVSVTMVKKI